MRAPALLVWAAAAPAGAFAADYLTVEQASRLMFPDADRFEAQQVALTPAQMRQLDEAGVRARSAQWTLRAARRQDQLLGWVVVDEVVGKFELITYAVGLNAGDGAVRQLEILSYRESHGGEIRLPAWRRQFVDRKPGDAIELGRDIANISGATLSCRHVTDGVRRIVRLVQLLRRDAGLK